MTDSEKLQAVITYAIGRGFDKWWTPGFSKTDTYWTLDDAGSNEFVYVKRWSDGTPLEDFSLSLEEILFNKELAKAVWGEEWYMTNYGQQTGRKLWQYHLQQAVISDNVIDYYYNNMEKV